MPEQSWDLDLEGVRALGAWGRTTLLLYGQLIDPMQGTPGALRSGGDADICWRMQDAGWELAYRERAR